MLVETLYLNCRHLKQLNLSFLPINQDYMSESQCARLAMYISKANQLMHLDLSATVLGHDLLLQILQNTKRSSSLVAIHLCHLTFNEAHWDFVWRKLKATHDSSKAWQFKDSPSAK